MPRVQAYQEMLVAAKETVIDQPNRSRYLVRGLWGSSKGQGVVI
jgi:hypothetical protein